MKITNSNFGRKIFMLFFFLFLAVFLTACVKVDEDGNPDTIINNEDNTPDRVTNTNTTTNTTTIRETVIVPNTSGQTSEPSRTPQTYSVDISNFEYIPSELRINKGDTVIWLNRDSAEHTVTSDTGSELSSSILSRGESYSHTFKDAGTFGYYCQVHPYMQGQVVVE